MKKIGKTKYLNLTNTRTKSQKRLMDKMAHDGKCPFCPNNIALYHKPPILKRGEYWLVTPNMFPYQGARIHLLFIYHSHIENISNIDPKAWKEFARYTRWAENHFKIVGGTLFMRFGDTDFTSGTIAHLHAQMVSGARYYKGRAKRQRIDASIGYQKN